ncbi:MAG: phage tail protein [Oceanihabitans sp.]|nr:phage tail protein [Oceanihabitans sp.]
MFAGNFTIAGWEKCEGQLMPINQNTALFSLLGTTYGGNGVNTFGLPDLRGRVPMHYGNGYTQGDPGGSATNSLSVANLPAHNHAVTAVVDEGDSSLPTNNYPAETKLLDKEYASGGTTSTMNSSMIGNTGSNVPVNNMQPYQTVTFLICVSGIYPPRN